MTANGWRSQSGAKNLETIHYYATTPVVADFLTYLFTVKNFGPVTIAGHRTTITNTLAQVTGTRPGGEYLILCNQYDAERPRFLRSTPYWDLALVLHVLWAYSVGRRGSVVTWATY